MKPRSSSYPRWLASLLSIVRVAIVLVALTSTALAATPAEIYTRSYALEAKGEYEAALRALQDLPKTKQTYVFRLRSGWLLYLAGREFDAMEEYRRAVTLAPDAVEPLLGLMLPQMALKLWLDTRATGKLVLALDPHNYTAHARMAWASYSLGRYDEAAEHYRHNLELYPSDLEMRAGVGYCLLQNGDKARAAAEFREVLEVAPEHASAQAGLLAAER